MTQSGAWQRRLARTGLIVACCSALLWLATWRAWGGYASPRGWSLGVACGALCIHVWDTNDWIGNPKGDLGWTFGTHRYPILWRVQWAWIGSADETYIPLWIPFLLGLVLCPWAFTRRRGSALRSCPHCGYDLRGLAATPQNCDHQSRDREGAARPATPTAIPATPRCPECGAAALVEHPEHAP